MIHLVDQALERYLRAVVPLSEAAVDVSFAAPDKTWGKAINRPTVNLFLWDLKRSAPLAKSGVTEQTTGKRVHRRPPLPVMDLNYYVTAWATHESDEHQLLGSVLATILATRELPRDYLPAAFEHVAPVTIEVATSAQRKPGDFVSVLDGQLKPGLEMRATVEVDALAWREAGPATQQVALGVVPTNGATPRADPAEPAAPALPKYRRTRRGGSVVMEPEPADGNEPVTS